MPSSADGNGPVVTALTESLGSPALTVTFDGPLNLPAGALSAQNLANFQVNQLVAGVNPELVTTSGTSIPILSASYSNGPSAQVTLTLANPLTSGAFFRIFINGALPTGLVGGGNGPSAGIPFDGDNDDTGTGNFYALFAVGTSVSFNDSQGDQVSVGLTGPGAVNVWRELNGDVDQLSVVNAVSGQSTLSGSVVPAAGGAGQVYVGSVTIPVPTAFSLNGAANNLPPTFITPVNFTGDTTSGSNTIANVPSTAGLAIGQPVVGADIPVAGGTVIAALGANTITLNQQALATVAGVALAAFPDTIQASFTGDTTAGSSIISNVSSTAGLAAGQLITDASGANLPAGAAILAVGANTITLSLFATPTVTAQGVALTSFSNFPAPPAPPAPVVATSQNLPYTLTITPINNSVTPLLPGIQGAVYAQSAPTPAFPDGLWLIFGGRTNGMHDFNPSGVTNFPPGFQNLDIIVINPANWQTLVDKPWSQTNVPLATYNSLNSVAQEFYQQGDTLYAVGGYASPISASFTGNATSGSPIISNVSSVSGLAVGQSIAAAGIQGATIPVGATILAVGANTVTLDENATATATGLAFTAFSATINGSFTGDTAAGSSTIANVSSVSGLVIGQSITGAGIQAGTTISAVGATTLTLSQAATASATNAALTAFVADFTTYSTLTSLSVSGLITALVNGGSVAAGSGIQQISDPRFAVTGGEMLAIQAVTYLVLGQDFQGGYSFPPTANQTYTGEIRSFQISTTPTLAISNYQALRDPVNFRRRDGNAGPTLSPSGQPGLSYFGGVFTEPGGIGYRNPIAVDSNGNAQISTYQQFFNQYNAPHIPFFDARTGSMTTIFLGGISLYDFSAGQLVGPNLALPFVDDVTSFVTRANGLGQEYIMSPLPGLYGAGAGFFAAPGLPTSSNGVIQLTQLSGPTVLGYMYGGIFSQVPNPGGSGPGLSGSSNQVFQVTVNVQTPNQRFVEALYRDELGRVGDLTNPQDAGSWVNQLTNGTLTTAAVAAGVAHSFEARDYLVKGWYQSYLGRQPVNGEELGWVTQLQQGRTEESVLSQILGSAEFFNEAQSQFSTGTPPERFVQALYQQLLNRTPQASEVASWVNALPRLGRSGVALGFLASLEYRTDLFTSYYETLLHRVPSPTETQLWSQSGLDVLSVRIDIESSAEFFTNG